MKVKISPAYLGLKAGQSKRSKRPDRRYTRNIWMTKDGLRIPVVEMTDGHLIRTLSLLHGYANKVKDYAQRKAEELKKLDHEYDKWLHSEDINYFELDDNWFVPEKWSKPWEEVAKMGVQRLLKFFVPCYGMMVMEGYKRGLVHSSGFPTDKGFRLLGLNELTGYGKDEEKPRS